jgi:threonine/homoserine/homoserine lactone efflux protein
MSSLASFYLRGLFMGFAIAAPVGAIGVLCIRRTLVGGWALGLATGLGAATADAVYGAVAAFGITAITSMLLGVRGWLQVVGGAFLLYLGVRTFLERPRDLDETLVRPSGLLAAWGSTFLLTLGNPMTILSFAAVFAGLGIGAVGGPGAGAAGGAVTLVAGVFTGSALWWVFLSVAVGLVRHRLDVTAMRWVNRGSGVVVGGFGVAALVAGLLAVTATR